MWLTLLLFALAIGAGAGLFIHVLFKSKARNKPTSLVGRRILVTGACGGIGTRLVQRLIEKGARVEAWDINEDALKLLAKKMQNQAQLNTRVVDLAKRSQIRDAIKEISMNDAIYGVINNAGNVSVEWFHEASDEAIDRQIAVNQVAPMTLTQAVLPMMMKNNCGHIVVVASASGLISMPRAAVYSATKHGVCGFIEAVRFELRRLKKFGVRVTVVCPVGVNTRMFAGYKAPIGTPLLEADEVAKATIDSMVRYRETVYLPRFKLYLSMVLKNLLPTSVSTSIYAGFGGLNMLDNVGNHIA